MRPNVGEDKVGKGMHDTRPVGIRCFLGDGVAGASVSTTLRFLGLDVEGHVDCSAISFWFLRW